MARYGFFLLGLLGLSASAGLAEPVVVSLEAELSGDSLIVGLIARPLTGLAGGDVEFSYDEDVLEILQVRPTLQIRGWTLVANMQTVGVVKVSMASGSGLEETAGRLLELVFTTELPALEALMHLRLEDILLSNAQAQRAEVAYEPPAPPPEGPIAIDFDPADGDQQQRTAGNAVPGKAYELQLNVGAVPEVNGWSASIEYDPNQVRYVSGSFKSSDFIPGLLALADEKEGVVSVGGTVLGTAGKNSGDGVLGTLSFEVLEGFTDSTEFVLTRVTFRRLDGVEDKRIVRSYATITSESILSGDFDENGKVDFDDFFLFADAFGGANPRYDLDNSGAVDFDDFFIFADNFGAEA